ncbi:MAG: PLP-dependent aminotransferase family protein [Ardenticatenaceae bacterium]|nr:PLP-dependent aminotransferase family protein [Ardenticatenaceae bacterium]
MHIKLKKFYSDPLLDVMDFLSEVTLDFPNAISFATGSPMETFFDVESSIVALDRFVEHRARITNKPRAVIFNSLGQYNRTNGIINDLVMRHLAIDEDIHVPPEAIMVTSGYQEAMAILMIGLFDPLTDVVLVSNPTYIGTTGLAKILGVPIVPIHMDEAGLNIDILLAALEEIRLDGKRPRALYEIPDFNNPLGTSMPLSTRHELLQVAYENDLIIIEDNPYGMFAYDGKRLPTLKSLDKDGVVIYIGTFSKTIFPGLRMGFLVADQQIESENRLLAEELSKVKGFTTVNTSPLLQAMVGGILLESNGSLLPIVESKLQFYRTNRDRMVARLAEEFGGDLGGHIRWNRPSGGFFLTVTLPFTFDEQCFRICASEYGLLCCPMSFFSLDHARDHQIRLSFSYVTLEQIDEGIRRLAQFVRDRLFG